MSDGKVFLSWLFAISLGSAGAVLADEPVSFVVYPESEVFTAEQETDRQLDRIFNQPVVIPMVSEALFEADCCPNLLHSGREGGCSPGQGCGPAGACTGSIGWTGNGECESDSWIRFDADATSVLPADNPVDELAKMVLAPKDWFDFPVNVGGWHWWNIDTGGVGNGGYGAKGFEGTYAYYLIAQPEWKLDEDRKIGGFIFFAGRDDTPYRPYYSRNFWFVEGYASYTSEDNSVIKAGLVNTKFGLDYYLGFIGTAPYFDGFIQDADYGVSWEKTHQVCDDLSIDTSAQFFFNDGEWNGSLQNHDQESVAGISERNTFVMRARPKWTLCDGSTLAWGVSGLVGGIDSKVAGFTSGTRSAWGTDFDYLNGPLNLRGEVLQLFGPIDPTRFASGGPSNRITSFTTEAGYTVGPVRYRGAYSASFDSNPDGRQNIWSLGTVTQVTPNIRVFTEYTEWTVDGNSNIPGGSATIIEGVQMVVHWQY